MSDEITFLPWLRRGLAQALTGKDPLTGPLARGPAITGWVQVEDQRVNQVVRVMGSDTVTGLAPGQVIREEPRPDSSDVEPSYFPLVELSTPDVPWMFTAAADDGTGRLRPWLVLVCVREQDGVSITAQSGAALPLLRIDAPADPARELPNLDDSWAWAHVQSLVDADLIEDAISAASGQVIARIMCPRRTLPDAGWLACLVPAFVVSDTDPEQLTPTWGLDVAAPFEIPVYHHWRFTTGAAGTFETLCRRLKPDGEGADLGLHPMEVGDPGLVEPAAGSVLLDMEGALETPGVQPREWDPTHKQGFQEEIVKLLDEGIARVDWTPPRPGRPYDPTTQDPVVAPPLYGAWPAGLTAVPDRGWARTLNDHPVRRAGAGLGAVVVRTNQEALVAAAWDQAGDLRATVTALNCGRLAVEVGRSLARRVATLPDGDVLQVTARLHTFMPDGATTVRGRLASSAVPGGLVSGAHLRQTRPTTPLARDWRTRTGVADSRLGERHVATTLLATRPGVATTALDYAVVGAPRGAQVADPTLEPATEPPQIAAMDPVIVRELETRTQLARRRTANRVADPKQHDNPLPTQHHVDVSTIAATVRSVIDPLASVRENLALRIPALEGLIAVDALPTTIPLGPTFEDGLSADVIALSSTWLLPGVEALARNRVRLVAENLSSIGAFMIGANHEMARELLWRGYPVDLRATFFHRFWNYIDSARTDIGELIDWGRPRNVVSPGAVNIGNSIKQNMEAGDATSTVIVIRGDIVRRYPTAHYYLQAASREDGVATPVEGVVEPAMFLGTLDRDTVFFGFDLDPETVVGNGTAIAPGYFLAIEEQPGAPRFGLDDARPKQFGGSPKSWDGLAWGHLVDDEAGLEALTHAPATHDRLGAVTDTTATWGKNAAHQARACWQRPFRMLIHADDLI